MKFSQLTVGQTGSLIKTITDQDVMDFARISGDLNPVHLDEDYAKTTRFGRRIVHGMLSASLVSAVLAEKCPGSGCIYLEQTLKFLKPVFIGDTLTAVCTIETLIAESGLVVLETVVENQSGQLVITGTAKVRLFE